MSKRIFITGASTGLGKAAALMFAERGWEVVATMRKPEAETEMDAIANITKLPLDVTDLDQIADAVKKTVAMGQVDVVFNNAGYGLAGPFEGAKDEQLVRQLNTNLLGVMRVTKAFIPHLRAQGSGLFITTTSIGGLITFPFNSVYHATKWALEGWSESMAFELKPFGIGIKTVSPGGIRTDFASRSLDMSMHEDYAEHVQKVMSAFQDPARAANYSSSEQIAEVVYEAATDGKEQLRYVAGADAKEMYAQRLAVGDEAFRAAIAERFLG
ncbi:MAG: SDR family oxidoreductase [Bacteroidota bacterium]